MSLDYTSDKQFLYVLYFEQILDLKQLQYKPNYNNVTSFTQWKNYSSKFSIV